MEPTNYFEIFTNDKEEDINIFLDQAKQHEESSETKSLASGLKIRKRKIQHKHKFGRGANHPSFFLRKFLSKLSQENYSKFYQSHPQILESLKKRAKQYRKSKNRFNLNDLKDIFGNSENPNERLEKYLNSKMFFQAISNMSLQMVVGQSKCNEVLNHLISIEKYSSRLGNPLLVGRVQFQ